MSHRCKCNAGRQSLRLVDNGQPGAWVRRQCYKEDQQLRLVARRTGADRLFILPQGHAVHDAGSHAKRSKRTRNRRLQARRATGGPEAPRLKTRPHRAKRARHATWVSTASSVDMNRQAAYILGRRGHSVSIGHHPRDDEKERLPRTGSLGGLTYGQAQLPRPASGQ
jgi:hypothetical protein